MQKRRGWPPSKPTRARPFVSQAEREAAEGQRFARSVELQTRMPQTPGRPIEPVPRYLLTRKECAASLGMSLNHFERHVQGVHRHAHYLVETPVRPLRAS